jgi:hypothetical protein
MGSDDVLFLEQDLMFEVFLDQSSQRFLAVEDFLLD